jgi:DNA mismatch repair protein MutL
MPVRMLDEHVINKIAAGEVVERPASVVKELVENSLDAGARTLQVFLEAGGRNLIQVVDDGSGMDRTDALMCLERHATSKIRSDEDLFKIGTLGFRGEAIPSIAAISRFELKTRRATDEAGTRVVVDGGILKTVEPAGCAAGTDIRVASLFFNVPARRKFLRSVETELSHCLELITREALIRPDLDVEVLHEGRELIRCVPAASRRQRAVELLGEHGEALVPVQFKRGGIEVEGLISPVGVHRASGTNSSYLYVNGRYVRDTLIRKAISNAYAGIVPKDRYPMVVLEVRVPPGEVDVNVHPAKVEVRFVHALSLLDTITQGLRAALQEHGIHRPVATEARYQEPEVQEKLPAWGEGRIPALPPVLGPPKEPVRAEPVEELEGPPPFKMPDPASEPFKMLGARPDRTETNQIDIHQSDIYKNDIYQDEPTESEPLPFKTTPVEPEPRPAFAETPRSRSLLPVQRYSELRIIGQLAKTYILCEASGQLLIVDQHAAHERVNLERLLKKPEEALGPTQKLLTPLLVELAPARARALASSLEVLGAYGLEVSFLGGGTFGVQSVPPALKKEDLKMLLADAADEILGGGAGRSPEERFQRVLATMACHASVTANQELSLQEMRDLLFALDIVDFGVCAHGRPVVVRLDLPELERRFHRT